MTTIRPARPDDAPGVRAVLTAAFGGSDEADLVDRLYADKSVITALVALEDGEIVGHILFSHLEIADFTHDRQITGAALAPLAVAPTHQNFGIGSALVRQGLDTCKELSVEAVVVLGHTSFYSRFGFSAEKAECLKCPFSGPYLMILDLKPGILDDFSGMATYPPAFGVEALE